MKNNLVLAVFAASSYAFLFTACDSKEEKDRKASLEHKADALEDQAKQVKKDAEKTAELTKEAGKDSAKEIKEETKANADAIKKEGELKEQQLKDAADQERDKK
ncbi:MAG: hypothetical protein JWO82_299 [Akkermansiaceae bacterium]|nr:hypothetical protein [Akkermansiaceae bacterium]